MLYTRVITLILIGILLSLFGGTSVYAEECGDRPVFSTSVHWVSEWNVPGYFNHHGEVVGDGVAYDGRIIYGSQIADGKIAFLFDNADNANWGPSDRMRKREPLPDLPISEIKDLWRYARPKNRFFFEDGVTSDPRLSAWWQQSIELDEFDSLWNAIEIAALSHGHPDVTLGIINHMVSCGVVSRDEFKTMTGEDISGALATYTAQATNVKL